MEQITIYYTNNDAKAGQLKRAKFSNQADVNLFLDIFKGEITVIDMN